MAGVDGVGAAKGCPITAGWGALFKKTVPLFPKH